MGRCFSTAYRLLLVATSLSGVTLTILSATSCAFVDYDHQYKNGNRELVGAAPLPGSDVNGLEGRILQGNNETSNAPTPSPFITFNDINFPTLAPSTTLDGIIFPTTSPSVVDEDNVTLSGDNGTLANATDGGNSFGFDDIYEKYDDDAEETPNPEAVTGSAGLFCSSEPFIKSIFSEDSNAFKKIEDEIKEESNNEESEELARNGAIVGLSFGALALLILAVECVLGWKMCCEKWIVGFILVVACVGQGMTFLFFDSDEFCDGDIIHEIMNQEPCTIGKGGAMSIAALVLYFVTILMVCRVPSDDPYSLHCCRRKKKAGRGETELSSGQPRGELVHGDDPDSAEGEKTSGKDNIELPQWLSEQREREII